MTAVDRRLLIAWGLLVAATVCSIEVFDAAGFGLSRRTAGIAVLAIAFVKVRIIGREFMEIRHGPLWLRIVFDVWLVGLGVILLGLYAAQEG